MIAQARHEALLVQEVDDELVIYDRERNQIHSLNPSTALVWRHCDGKTSISEMAAVLASELNLPADEDVIWLALKQLDEAHLLRESPAPTINAANLSRREVLRKLGRIGQFALLLPVVTSITAPTPAMAQYTACAGFCQVDSGFIEVTADRPCLSEERCVVDCVNLTAFCQ